MNINTLIYWVAIACFCISLALPGILNKTIKVYPPNITFCHDAYIGPCWNTTGVLDTEVSIESTKCGNWAPEVVSNLKSVDTTIVQAYCTAHETDSASVMYGWQILLLGFLGFAGQLTWGILAWYANVIFFIALLCVKNRSYLTAFCLSLGATFVALLAFLLESYPGGDEGGITRTYVDHLGVGYYVWEVSLVLFASYCMLKIIQPKDK